MAKRKRELSAILASTRSDAAQRTGARSANLTPLQEWKLKQQRKGSHRPPGRPGRTKGPNTGLFGRSYNS